LKSRYFFSIRTRFLLSFCISIISGFLIALVINGYLRQSNNSYSSEIHEFKIECLPIFKEMKSSVNNKRKLREIIDKYSDKMDIYVVDKHGQILIESKNNYEKQLDIDKLLNIKDQEKNLSAEKVESSDPNQIKYYNIGPLDKNTYVVSVKFLQMKDNVGAFVIGIGIFVLSFLALTYGRVKYIHELSEGLIEISKGDFKYRIQVNGKDELAMLGESINYMVEQLNNMKEKDKLVEKNKNILIENVSHDLRTPLTSIIGYVKLLKDIYKFKDNIGNYIEIIDKKLQRLEELITDLFEYTKLESQDINLSRVEFSINEFMRQVVEGFMPICNENNLELFFEVPDEELMINADPSKMFRVFENIISNAIRYSDKPGRIMVKVLKNEEGIIACIENKGETLKVDDLDKIFDRFYRTDEARNTETGGSGLGLAIAKSIIELHGGSIWADCKGNKVCFYVLIINVNEKHIIEF
jgi:signal transduction histidine kinase